MVNTDKVLGESVVPSRYDDDDTSFSLRVQNTGDITLKMGGVASHRDRTRTLYVLPEDLAKGMSEALGWTIITDPLPDLEEKYISAYSGSEHTPEDLRRTALVLLAVAEKKEQDAQPDVVLLASHINKAFEGTTNFEEVARNLLRAGVKPPTKQELGVDNDR